MKSDTEECLIKYNKYILIIIGIILIGITIYAVGAQEMITAQITKTQTGLVNGSWINLSSEVNATEGTLFFEVKSETWTKKRVLHINNIGGSALSYYQLNINVSYINGMNNDFSDLRFYNDTDGTIQPYWIESKVNGSWAKVWINISHLNADSWTNNTYYMYYSNPSATYNNSLGRISTLLLFDDFDGTAGTVPDSSKWTVFKDTYGIVQLDGNGRLKIASTDTGGSGTDGWSNVYSNTDIEDNVLMEFKWQMGTQWEWYPSFHGYIQASGMPTAGNGFPSNANYVRLYSGAQYPNSAYRMDTNSRYAGTTTNTWDYDITDTAMAWVRIATYGTTVRAWISYDGINWIIAGNGIATNDLSTGRVGFQGGANGDRQNDNRIEYVLVRKYASLEPSVFLSDDEIEFFF